VTVGKLVSAVRKIKVYALALYKLSALGAAVIVKEVTPVTLIHVTWVEPDEFQIEKVRFPQFMLELLAFTLSVIV